MRCFGEGECGGVLLEKKEKSSASAVADFSDPLRDSSFVTTANEHVEVQETFDNKFRTSLSSTLLSISPFLNFPLPYLESETGKKCKLRSFFSKELFYSKQWSSESEKVEKIENILPTETKNENVNPPHEFLTMKISVPADNKDLQTALADYRRSGGMFKKVTRMKVVEKKVDHSKSQISRQKSHENMVKDAFDIYNHQRLSVLFCR